SRARPDLQHASDSKYCVRCGHPYRYDAAYVGHLGAYHCDACGHARPPLAAAALCLGLGVRLPEIVAGLERFRAAFGRFERFAAGERSVLLLLIKNPARANQVVRTLEEAGVPPTIVVALTDRIADGRDVSWIWDVDFEPLLARAERVVVTGERAAELG